MENGNTQFPVVADPEGLDLNQAFVKYEEAVTVTFGRQRITHDGQLCGRRGVRQNEQTYDALRLQTEVGSVKLDYSYVWNVNRIFGPDDGAQPADWEGDTHLLNATLFDNGKHKIKGQAYLLILKTTMAQQTPQKRMAELCRQGWYEAHGSICYSDGLSGQSIRLSRRLHRSLGSLCFPQFWRKCGH